MVNWNNLFETLSKNVHSTFMLEPIVLQEIVYDLFKLEFKAISLPTKEEVKEKAQDPIPAKLDFVYDSSDDELPPPPPPPMPKITTVPVASVAVAPVAPVSTPALSSTVVDRKEKKKYTITKTIVDPLVLGLELEEPLYSDSPHNTKAATEREAATRYEAVLNDLYKLEGGRNRGWTKTLLEQWIKPRVSSGGNMKELDRAKVGFTWQLLNEDKAHSAFLDFLCVAKKIRVAVWFPETKTIHVYPAADASSVIAEDLPLYNVDCKGALIRGPRNGKELYEIAVQESLTVLPCLSIMSALGRLSLEELENVGRGLGMATVEGKKNERIAAIASFKLRARLQKK